MNIKQIAEMCGTSTSTVSRILNNKPDVNSKTRERVIQLMNELGFRPNVVTNRNETIGVVTPITSWPEFMGPLLNGIMETAYASGKLLTLIPMQSKMMNEEEDISHFCRSNGLCGMLVINPLINSKLPASLVEHDIPHVIIAASYRNSKITWVDVDNIAGCMAGIEHLYQQGHRRIALFHNFLNNPCDADRLEGYRAVLHKYGLELDPGLMVEMSEHVDLGEKVERVMSQKDRPTALFCTTYRGSLAVSRQLQKLNIRIPEDVSFVGFGDYDVSPLMNPPMTTIHQPIYEMGKAAVNVFQQVHENKGDEPIQKLLPTKLIVRNSTKPL